MPKETVLQQFGLTDAEVKVYLALLTIGEATASAIARRNGMNRTFTYDRLKKLSDFGLVSSIIKDSKKYFKAADPSQLLAVLKEREEQVKEILPELEQLKKGLQRGPEVEVYSSIKGVMTAVNLMLSERKAIYLYGTLQKFQEALPVHFDIWNKRRIKQNIHLKILSSEDVHLDAAETDLLSEEEHSITSTFTFGENVLIILWGDVPIAILLKSKEIAGNTIAFFNAIWDREVKIYSGSKGIQLAFFELLNDTKEFIGFGYNKLLADVYTKDVSDQWHVERIKRGIPVRIISYDDSESRDYFGQRTESKKDFDVRFLPKELQGPACISLSDTMIATFVYTEKKFRVIVNKNKETVAVYKKYFEELWGKSTL
ncbi:TrmB family transcriptional regulator [Candidatus Woesearchaeota archaeon]|nr:TrmB family transcriptional regulator [Candidatus Woesearchaeota archaeon]